MGNQFRRLQSTGTMEHSRMSRFILVLAIFMMEMILMASCHGPGHGPGHGRGPGRGQHGSHPHMNNHFVPKPGEAPVRNVLVEEKMIHDGEHLMEDLKEVYTQEQIDRMSAEEKDFHYFKLHDYDNNNRLDGLEILAAIYHIVPEEPDLALGNVAEGVVLTEEEQHKLNIAKMRYEQNNNHYISMVDHMFRDSDLNKDGFINYHEFVKTRRPGALF